MRIERNFWRSVAAVALGLAAATSAAAQCSMCRTALASQGTAAADTFDRAILILLLPAAVVFNGIFLLAFRLRSTSRRQERDQSG